jgi:hypothetical protein
MIKGYQLDKLLYAVKKDEKLRERFLRDFDAACLDFNLSDEEKTALKSRDYAALYELGAKDELILFLAKLSKK